jgi:hypothetical protein
MPGLESSYETPAIADVEKILPVQHHRWAESGAHEVALAIVNHRGVALKAVRPFLCRVPASCDVLDRRATESSGRAAPLQISGPIFAAA